MSDKKEPKLSREQMEARVTEFETKLNVTVRVDDVTIGDVSDLQDSDIPFTKKLELIQSMLSAGEARSIKLVNLSQFMEIISLKIDLAADPT